jgi:hypothetical protein
MSDHKETPTVIPASAIPTAKTQEQRVREGQPPGTYNLPKKNKGAAA